MTKHPVVQPLSQRHRSVFFYLLVSIFVLSLPVFFLYATGYRFSLSENSSFVSTGGIYVAAERTGAEIYIDSELVRETRVFRRAFYAQSLVPGTHRVHVQKEDHHTWVKELPVYPHLVTEAQAFNLPLVPQVRIISPWKDESGNSVLFASSTLIASSTSDIVVATSTATTTLSADSEYTNLYELFSTTSATSTLTLLDRVSQVLIPEEATSTELTSSGLATTTVKINDIKLFQSGDDIFAQYTGVREDMPYYYCAEEFEPLGTSTAPLLQSVDSDSQTAVVSDALDSELVHPIQTVSEETECEPAIRIDRQWQNVKSFDFLPGSTDFVVLALDDGIYVTEVDNRAWQNSQPLLLGNNLDMRVESGNVYVYDEDLIYHVQLESS